MAAPQAPQRWLFGPAPDLLFGCGLLYAILFAGTIALGGAQAYLPLYLSPLLLMVLSTPHYGATLMRVYDQRVDRRRYAIFSVWATAAIALWFFASQRWVVLGSALLTLYMTWSPWHYTGQNYGIAVMLLRRRGVALDPVSKRWLYAAFVLSYLLTFAVIHESQVWARTRILPLDPGDIRFLPLGTPAQLTLLAAGAWGVALLGAGWRLLRLAPLADLGPGLMLVLSQALWFALPALAIHWQLFAGREPLGPDVQVYGFFWIAIAHSAQYLWITAYYARASRGWSGSAPYFLKVFAAGAAVWTLPRLFSVPFAAGREGELALLVASAVNIHHFVLDGAIWKLRDGPIARVLIRSESAAEDETGSAPASRAWQRPLVWTTAGACAVMTVFVFAASWFWIPSAVAGADRARAVSLMGALSALGIDSAVLRSDLARLYAVDGDFEAAAAELARSVTLAPRLEGYGALVEVLGMAGRFEEALPWCEEMLAMAPDDPRALQLAAMIYARTGRRDEARSLARRAAEQGPAVASQPAAPAGPALY